MLQRDYILELIAQFAESVRDSLKLASRKKDLAACEDVERQIGELLELDYRTALQLAPDSLVTMMVLSGMGDAVASYVCFALRRLSEIYAEAGNEDLAHIRMAQAMAVAESFNCSVEDVPEEFADLG